MTVTLHYFRAAARASSVRLMLSVAKIDYVNKFYTREEWPAFKPKTPLGQMPVLELEDGTMIPQSGAIFEYVAKRAGWTQDGVAGAKVAAIQHQVVDTWMPLSKYFHTDEANQPAIKDEVVKQFTDLVKRLEEYVAKTAKDGYVLGTGRDTTADLIIADAVYMPPPPMGMPFDREEVFRVNAPVLKSIADRFKKTHEAAWKQVQPPYIV